MSVVGFRADRPILLVGLMGSGKTTIGPRLAKRLGIAFIDSDREVEHAEGMPVSAIFESLGEAHFRRRERQILTALAAGPPQVIAAGGGALIDVATRRRLVADCTLVWLDAEPAVLAARLAGPDDRPLLRSRNPETALTELAAARNAGYAEAHHRIAVDALTPDEVADRIVALLREH